MKKEEDNSPNFLILCDNKKTNIKNSLSEVECFLNKFTKFSDIFTVLKIAKKNNYRNLS